MDLLYHCLITRRHGTDSKCYTKVNPLGQFQQERSAFWGLIRINTEFKVPNQRALQPNDDNNYANQS